MWTRTSWCSGAGTRAATARRCRCRTTSSSRRSSGGQRRAGRVRAISSPLDSDPPKLSMGALRPTCPAALLRVAAIRLALRAGDRRRHQVVDVERLGDQTPDAGRVEVLDGTLTRAGQHDHPIEQSGAVTLQAIEQLEAVDIGHHQVEKDDGVIVAAELIVCDASVAGAVNVETLAGKEGGEEAAQGLIIVDDENRDRRNGGIRPGHDAYRSKYACK